MAGLVPNGVLLGVDPTSLFLEADVVIDFSTPDASMHHVALAAETGKAMVIGTTGLTPDQEDMLRQAAKQSAIVYCANTSVGVTLLTQLVEQVAAKLKTGWDIEILGHITIIKSMPHRVLRWHLEKPPPAAAR